MFQLQKSAARAGATQPGQGRLVCEAPLLRLLCCTVLQLTIQLLREVGQGLDLGNDDLALSVPQAHVCPAHAWALIERALQVRHEGQGHAAEQLAGMLDN